MRLFASAANGTGVDEYPIETYHWFGTKVTRTYGQSGPARMEFRMACAQHTKPIPNRAKIWLIDESYGYWGTPVFEGFVETILPTSSLEVGYVCYSGERRAAAEAFVMSVPYTTSAGVPVEGVGAVPSLIFNVKEENDEEIAFSVDNDATCATIVQRILDDAAPLLRTMMAAPVDAGTAPYVSGDMSTMDYKPQTKIAFSNETVSNAVMRTLQMDPRFRSLLIFGENERQWRIYDVTASGGTTLTLNDYSDKTILTLNLNISTDRRYSATKIYGPRKSVTADFKTSDSTLTENWSGGEQSTFEAGGPDSVGSIGDAGRKWTITDSTKRNLASRLPSDALVPYDGGFGITYLKTRFPTFLATYDGGTTWETVHGAVIDNRLGTVTVPNRVYRYTSGGSPVYSLPDDVWLLAAYYDVPLSVRYPLTGWGGTIYSVMGAMIENKIMDPGLAVGWENGTPVASAVRTAQFQTLAQRFHEATCDIAYAGGFSVAGIDYDFWGLNQRINLTAVDANGDPLVTGWEAINAPLDSVELDFEQRITTCNFNSDQLQFLKVDPEQLKEELKIEAMQFRYDYGPKVTISFNGVRSTFYAGSSGDANEFGNNDSAYAPKLNAVNDAENYAGGGWNGGSPSGEGFAPSAQGPQAWGSVLDTHNPGQSQPSKPGKAFKQWTPSAAPVVTQATTTTEGTVFDNPLAD